MNIVVLDYPPGVARRTKRLGLERYAPQVNYIFDDFRPKRVEYEAYINSLAEKLDGSTANLVAYCASASIARGLGFLTRAQAVCLINPEYPKMQMAENFLSPLLPDAIIEPLSDDRLSELENCLTEANLHTIGEDTMLDRAAETAAGFASLQIEWIAHLAAASAISGKVTGEFHVNSTDHLCAASCLAKHIVIDSDSDDMFQYPGLTEKIVSEFAAPG